MLSLPMFETVAAYFAEAVDFAYRWQTLIGAFLGGTLGLLAALLVAHSARRREEIASAMLVVRDLTDFVVMKETHDELWKLTGLGEDKHEMWLLEKLLYRWPVLSREFEVSAIRLMPVNPELAAHVSLFQKMHLEVGMTLDEIKGSVSKGSRDFEERTELAIRARRLAWMTEAIAGHASCASWLINRLVLSRTYLLLRAKRIVWKTARDHECRARLQTGSPENSIPDQL